jgi:hypothetical protein
MPLTVSLTAAATTVGGPFPPNYLPGCYGYVAAASNPSADHAGAIGGAGTYFGAPIVAVANDSHAAPTQLIVALEGTYDQTFLGNFTDTNGNVYDSSAAAFVTSLVGTLNITTWTWQLSGNPGLSTGTVTFGDTFDTLIDLQAVTTSSTEIDLAWINNGPLSNLTNYELWRGVAGATPTLYQTLGSGTTFYNDTGLAADTQYNYYVVATWNDGTVNTSVELQVTTPEPGVSATFNCDCETAPLPVDGYMTDTLLSLRTRMLIRCGYAAMAANPPPGIVLEFNERLRDAQNQLYRQHYEKRIIRMWSWQMVPNQRYYGFDQDQGGCRVIDPLSINWVGFEDLNQAWYPLTCGIDPVLYTRAQISTGWPTHYEIRSCIEIFPAPRANYTLWAKAAFTLDPFLEDTDVTTLDAEGVYLLACGTYMTSKGHPEAASVMTQAGNWTKLLTAGMHDTRRYVPRTRVQTPMTPPRFLPLEE